jgi:molybdenum cofactor cytidylyltransferase
MIDLQGKPILTHVLNIFQLTKIGELIVVASSGDDHVSSIAARENVRIVLNHHPDEGMAWSLKLAIGAVQGQAVVVGMGDQPLLLPSTINTIIDFYEASSEAKIVVPVYNGQRGNPVLFDRVLFPQIMRIHGDVGAKSVVMKNASMVKEVLVDDVGVLLDIDNPHSLETAERVLAARRLREREPRQ